MLSDDISLPFDDLAEKAVLGAMLIDNSKIPLVAPILHMDDFYRKSNGIIYWVIQHQRVNVDLVSVASYLRVRSKIHLVQGARPDGGTYEREAYIASVVDSTHRSSNAVQYAAIVKHLADRRRIIEAADAAVHSQSPEVVAHLAKVIASLNGGFLE